MSSHYIINDYQVGIICALPLERTAIESMLDGERHPQIGVPSGDNNIYTFGSIGKHNVVIASLASGRYGTVSAAGVANDMRRSFPQLKYGLMVGIAGAMPRPDSKDGDIRLGDIIVGCANGVPSVINYNMGKDAHGGFDIRSELAEPPEGLARAVASLQTEHQLYGPTYLAHLSSMLKSHPRFNEPRLWDDYYNIPDSPDRLFRSSFVHPSGVENCNACLTFEKSQITRKDRFLRMPPDSLSSEKFVRFRDDGFADYPKVFFGTIGSSDALMKLGTRRDVVFERVKQQRKANLLCFEMEASGIVRGWPCLVIRGICDYSDSHKNDEWQNFAAATAAAYAKDLILHIPPEMVTEAKRVDEALIEEEGSQGIQVSQSGQGTSYANFGSGSQITYQQSGNNSTQFNSSIMNFGSPLE